MNEQRTIILVCFLLFFVFNSYSHMIYKRFSHIISGAATGRRTMSSSIHTNNIDEVHEIPMNVVVRPLQSSLNQNKVDSIVATIQNPQTEHLVPPIDVLWITDSNGGNYYYSFGGCHRWAAHQKAKRDTIKAKLVKSTPQDLRVYLGSSTPNFP